MSIIAQDINIVNSMLYNIKLYIDFINVALSKHLFYKAF